MHNTKQLSTLIFDLGGVIVNLDLPLCISRLKQLGAEDVEKYLSNYGQSGFFLQWEKGEIGIDAFRNEIRSICTGNPTNEEIDAAWCAFLQDIPAERVQLLIELKKKYRLLLLSNSNPLHIGVSTRQELARHGYTLEDIFDQCFISYEMGLTKPHPEIFEQLMKDAGVTAEECLFLDDGPKNIDTAQAMGFQTYLVQQGEDLSFLLDERALASKLNPYAATVGFFDGVHAGHRFLIEELKSTARERNLLSKIITFSMHPRKVLHADFQPQLLTTLDEKLGLLQQTGVDEVVVLDFNREMAMLSAEDFIQQVLSKEQNVQCLLVGHDHRFGRNRADGFTEYVASGAAIGMEVVQAKRYTTDQFKHISSSEIRNALEDGNIIKATQLLNYRYGFYGYVVNGYQVGRKIGFPTANLKAVDPNKLIPGIGVYAVDVTYKNNTYRGMMNIGNRPTFDQDGNRSIEVHILDFDEDIYHQELHIRFVAKIRDERKFSSIDELINQLNIDRQQVMKLN